MSTSHLCLFFTCIDQSQAGLIRNFELYQGFGHKTLSKSTLDERTFDTDPIMTATTVEHQDNQSPYLMLKLQIDPNPPWQIVRIHQKFLNSIRRHLRLMLHYFRIGNAC